MATFGMERNFIGSRSYETRHMPVHFPFVPVELCAFRSRHRLIRTPFAMWMACPFLGCYYYRQNGWK